jgi:APA family basic amino acid/polyamine antiporter
MPMENLNSRKITLFTATAIVAANMIGTGVFTSLGFQVFDIQTGFSLISLWIIGGIAALCGALSYGELSAAMPRSGGEYHLLSRIYHPSVGFLSGWISVAVGFTAPIAAAAMAMGKYFSRVLIDSSVISMDSLLLTKIMTAIIAVTLVSIVHLFNVKFVSKFQIVFTVLKISLILGLVIFGFVLATGQPISFLPVSTDFKTIFSSPFAVSLVFVMYAYSGWNAAVYIASDIKNPGRNLPLSLVWGTVIVVLLYVPVNAVFLYAAPISEMMGQEDVGYIAANHIFGATGGTIMGVLISIGLISAISSMIWAGPRVTQVMGEDVKILKFLSIKNKNGVPHVSLLLQYVVVVILILTSSFETIIKYIGVMLSLSSFLTVFGVFLLRYRQPNLERPYKTWGYPVTPIIFLLVTGWMMFFVIKSEPSITIACIATIFVGLILFYINKRVEEKGNLIKF